MKCEIVTADESTIAGTCAKLAEFYINNQLITLEKMIHPERELSLGWINKRKSLFS